MDIPAWAARPEWADGLVRQVEAEFAETGSATPGWPDPHETGDPDRLEYSICSDPAKYRILDARVEAWARTVERRGLASASWAEPPYAAWVGAHRGPADWTRVRVLTPKVDGALSLLAATTLVGGEPFGIDLGVGRPDGVVALVTTVPDCGCDHCDHGSDGELEVVDGDVLTVARGGVVHARSGDTTATATVDGWHTSNLAPVEWLDAAVPVAGDVQRWTGVPWLG